MQETTNYINMKKFLFSAAAVLMTAFGALTARAQMPQQVPAAPIDSAVRVGKLDNGLTYYIRHNETPKGQADFFIAQKVGSILENEDQRGLAHFLEHMCFNGTENFPGNGVVDWLETVGVKFGQNLNAYTAVDKTVYNISSVPVARKGVQDSCLLILHDWADGLLLDPEEINKERGVIHEEWRRSNEGQMKILEEILPTAYPGSKYGERLPIGLMSVVDNFKPQVLRDYYETWYRPDNQAIIVVGDIDPDYIEGKIKEIFSPIKMPANPKERVYEGVPDNKGTIYAIGKDVHQPVPILLLYFKQAEPLIPREMRNTVAYFPVSYIKYMITTMLDDRLDEMSKKSDCPFAQAGVNVGNFLLADTKDAVEVQIIPKGNDVRPAIEAVYRELLRAARGGFTQSEYERAKTKYISSLEKAYEERNNRENTSYAEEYAANFTDNDPIPGIAYELQIAKQLEAAIPVTAINQVVQQLIGPDNRVFLGLLPDKEGFSIPTGEQIKAVTDAVDAETIEPYKEEIKNEPLIEKLPAPAVAKVSENKKWNATELTYPNGAKVIVKHTDFKAGEILFQAIAKGGITSLNEDVSTLRYLEYAMSRSGLGTYNNSDLTKYLSGKLTHLNTGVGFYQRVLDGSTTAKNLPTLMELIYMTFRAYDITPEDFDSMKQTLKTVLASQVTTPQWKFREGMYKNLYKAPAAQSITLEDVDKADLDATLSVVHNLYANPADFTFVFVGDVNVDSLRTLADRYIGGIPAPRIASVPFVQNPDFEPTIGANTVVETTDMTEPQTWCSITVSAAMPSTDRNRLIASMAGQILSNRLIKKIREEMGATYSIGAPARLSFLPKENFLLQIPFPMNPDRREEVLKNINELTYGMAQNITDEEFNPIQEFMIKDAAESLEKNDKWIDAMTTDVVSGIDTITKNGEIVRGITKKDIQDFMKAALDQNNYRVFLLNPTEKKK